MPNNQSLHRFDEELGPERLPQDVPLGDLWLQVGRKILSGDIKDGNCRMEEPKLAAQLHPVHAWHMDIGNDQAELSVHLASGGERRGTIASGDNAQPGLDQHAAKQPAEHLLVVNQKDSAWYHKARWPDGYSLPNRQAEIGRATIYEKSVPR